MWKQITGFQDSLEYVNRLGFSGSGCIANRQYMLCKITDVLLESAGQYPFKVRYHRYKSEHGFIYPWLSTFTVVGSKGKVTLNMSTVKV